MCHLAKWWMKWFCWLLSCFYEWVPYPTTTQSCPWVCHALFNFSALSVFFLLLYCVLLLVLLFDACTILLIYCGVFNCPVSGVLPIFLFSVFWTILVSIWLLLLSLFNPIFHHSCCLPCFDPSGFFLSLYHVVGSVCSFPRCSMHCCYDGPNFCSCCTISFSCPAILFFFVSLLAASCCLWL